MNPKYLADTLAPSFHSYKRLEKKEKGKTVPGPFQTSGRHSSIANAFKSVLLHDQLFNNRPRIETVRFPCAISIEKGEVRPKRGLKTRFIRAHFHSCTVTVANAVAVFPELQIKAEEAARDPAFNTCAH